MDIVPLLAHQEENSFRSLSMGSRPLEPFEQFSEENNRSYEEVGFMQMGQSTGKINRVHLAEDDWNLPKSTIKLTVQEILHIKEVFKLLARLSPEDQCISKQTFLHYFPLGEMLGQRLFSMFDKDGDEKINLAEFLSGISLCLHGTMTDKCNLLFNMFDVDEDQGISQDELFNMLMPTLKAADSLSPRGSRGTKSEDGEDFSETARLLVHEAFEVCDLEQTGKLSAQNFHRWVSGHKELLKIVFNYPFQSVLKRTSRYEELQGKEKRNSRLHPQTWVNEYNDTSSSQELERSVNLDNARYLWSPLFPESKTFPPCRWKHAAILYRGFIYIFGGHGKSATLKDIWRYSLSENKWDQVEISGPTLPALEEHTAVLYKNHAYIFGGLFATDQKTPFWSYEFETSKWKDLSHSKFQKEPVNRRGHSAVIYRDSLFLFGGALDTGHPSNELWRYNFSTFRWHLLAPKDGTEVIPARHSHSAIVHNNSLWIFGGIDAKGKKNDLWTWDFGTRSPSGSFYQRFIVRQCLRLQQLFAIDKFRYLQAPLSNHDHFTWRRVKQKNSPSPVARHTASKIGSLMIIFGGEGGNEPKNETWAFNFDSLEWKSITPLSSITPTQRYNHTMIALSPYSAHCGPLPYTRPSTTKSVPDTHRQLSGNFINNPAYQNFCRAASVESVLDNREKRMMKGKSLTFDLDNAGYDKSLPDVTDDAKLDVRDFSQDTNVLKVQSFSGNDFEEIPQFTQKNWAIVVIAGKGKLCTDMYKTSVDIWRCDIGPDIGMQYSSESSTHQVTRELKKKQQSLPISKSKDSSLLFKAATIKTQEADRSSDVGLGHCKSTADYDRLIITDLTVDESELDQPDLDRGSLLR